MKLLLLAACFCLASCQTPSKAYVAADAATYNVLAPAHRAYVSNDESLGDAERQRRLDLLESWRIRIEKAGGAVR